jgi:hypothetical protein
MDVVNKLKVYADNGNKANIRIPFVFIESDIDKDFVTLKVGDGIVLKLLASDVINAVNNSINK